MGGNPAEFVPIQTGRRADQCGFAFLTLGLQHPLHRVISNGALQLQDGVLAKVQPRSQDAGSSRVGEGRLLNLTLRLRKGLHAPSSLSYGTNAITRSNSSQQDRHVNHNSK
jgi:hypothetical protein